MRTSVRRSLISVSWSNILPRIALAYAWMGGFQVMMEKKSENQEQ